MRSIIGLVIMLTMALTVTACNANIPYAAAPYYHFPSAGDNEGNGS